MAPHLPDKPLKKMQSALKRATAFLTPSSSSNNIHRLKDNDFTKAPTPTTLFSTVDPSIDGEDCDHDCSTCTISYPKKFSIDEDDKLYGNVNGWSTHILVATGKTDWVRDVSDEKGSVMEAVGKHGRDLANGKLMLSASNMPVPCEGDIGILNPAVGAATTVLLLPGMTVVENVRPKDVPELLDGVIAKGVTNETPLRGKEEQTANKIVAEDKGTATETSQQPSSDSVSEPTPAQPESQPDSTSDSLAKETESLTLTKTLTFTHAFRTHPSPHRALILLCSQKTRDARCGQSAPLLRREFERHLRSLGLYRDLHDTRPGGVGIYFISHVGGHKYAANVMVYRRSSIAAAMPTEGGSGVATPAVLDGEEGGEEEGAVQGIWLARVRPEDCEGIIKFTVLQGKVVKPERQLRGGFDRERGVVSW